MESKSAAVVQHEDAEIEQAMSGDRLQFLDDDHHDAAVPGHADHPFPMRNRGPDGSAGQIITCIDAQPELLIRSLAFSARRRGLDGNDACGPITTDDHVFLAQLMKERFDKIVGVDSILGRPLPGQDGWIEGQSFPTPTQPPSMLFRG